MQRLEEVGGDGLYQWRREGVGHESRETVLLCLQELVKRIGIVGVEEKTMKNIQTDLPRLRAKWKVRTVNSSLYSILHSQRQLFDDAL